MWECKLLPFQELVQQSQKLDQILPLDEHCIWQEWQKFIEFFQREASVHLDLYSEYRW